MISLAVVLAFIGVKLFPEALRTNDVSFINGGNGFHWPPRSRSGSRY
ncbi:hypothetical protein [Actinoplanes couchii]|nr:hypothetical protein [Actinoplanes couchii]MDR6318078.1 putative tellurium resistance membrane protein TerC [Actinoplanes couchii]